MLSSQAKAEKAAKKGRGLQNAGISKSPIGKKKVKGGRLQGAGGAYARQARQVRPAAAGRQAAVSRDQPVSRPAGQRVTHGQCGGTRDGHDGAIQ